jgi:hypothetical protein
MQIRCMILLLTTNQLPAQSNSANGDNNRLQNCGQTAAGKQNGQSLECQQNSVQEDKDDTRGIALLTVIKEVTCRSMIFPIQSIPLPNNTSPEKKNLLVGSSNNSSISANQILPPPSPFLCLPPSDFTIHVEGENPSPSSFAGSVPGTTVIIGQGEYSVTETMPILPAGTEIIEHLSSDCNGTISLGESRTCIITNEILPSCPIGYERNILGICVPLLP